jgi:uncharacterized protein with von Willebrand factor type A (vWA) domain
VTTSQPAATTVAGWLPTPTYRTEIPMGFLNDLVNKAKGILDEAPKPTQTNAVETTWFDRRDWDKTLEEMPAVRDEVELMRETVDYVDDFAADLHASLFKIEPVVRDRGEITKTHVANRDVIETILTLPEVRNLRQHTMCDTYGTAMGMIALREQVAETLTATYEARAEEEERNREIERQIEEHRKRIEDLIEQAEEAEKGGDEEQQGQIAEDLDKELGGFPGLPQPGQVSGVPQSAINALRQAAKDVDDKLNEEEALAWSFGTEPGDLQKMNANERFALAQRLRGSRLAQFSELIGKFKLVQQTEARKRITNAASEVHGVTQSNEIPRMIAGEYLNFADPSLETLMLARYAEHQLNTHDVRGKEKVGQGPIICVVDESGSMGESDVPGGTREAWSKALALALCDQAKRRKRDFVYIGFAAGSQQHMVEFPKGETSLEKVLEMTEHFFGGGTHYDKPLRMALEYIENKYDTNGEQRPDIVFISDDEYAGLDPDFLAEWHRVKEKADVTCYGISIGCSIGGAMKAVSDNVRSITELVGDPANVGDLFRTI